VATDWPLSGQLHLRHQVDHAIWVRNVFGITVIRLRISYFRMRGSIRGRQYRLGRSRSPGSSNHTEPWVTRASHGRGRQVGSEGDHA
jgi:hypothetical protein